MRKNNLKILGTGLMIAASFSGNASEEYTPAEYQPAVEYTAFGSSASAATSAVSEQFSKDQALSRQSVTISPSNKSRDVAAQDSLISTANGTENSDIQADKSTQSTLMPIVIGIVAAVGFLGVRKKLPKPKSVRPVSVAEPGPEITSTGVERYIQQHAGSKTGVEKYLAMQQDNQPCTGVAKYLAKKALREHLKQ